MGATQRWLLLFLAALSLHAQTFVPAGIRFGGAVNPTSREFFSANRKSKLHIEDDVSNGTVPMIKLFVTVQEINKEGANSFWKADIFGNSIRSLADESVLVANDGAFFILRQDFRNWILVKRVGNPIPIFPSTGFPSRGSIFQAPEEKFPELDELNGQPIVRLWDRNSDQWSAFDIANEKVITPTPELIARWNSATRQKILDLVFASKREATLRKINRLSPKLTKLIQSTNAPQLRESHLEFLALRREPADRIWFERMLLENDAGRPPPGWPLGVPWRGLRWGPTSYSGYRKPERFFFETGDYARSHIDHLLAIFDKKPINKSPGPFPEIPDTYYLGAILGSVHLPMPILDKRGFIRIVLSPEAPQDLTSENLTTLYASPSLQISGDPLDLPDQIRFRFSVVLPGKYFIKAIWDKRSPRQNIPASPGSYESSWLGPITVVAATDVANLSINCTNRIAGGEPYYTADALATRLWETSCNEALTNFSTRKGSPAFVSFASPWTIATNKHTLNPCDEPAVFCLFESPPAFNTNAFRTPPQLIIRTRAQSSPQANRLTAERVLILDEHGCEFKPIETRAREQSHEFVFSAFPRCAATWRLRGYFGDETIFDYTITNHIRTAPISLPSQNIPFDLTLENLRVKVTQVGGYTSNGYVGLTFWEDGQSSTAWWAPEIILTDLHGNFISPEEACREEKFTHVLVRLHRNNADPEQIRRFEFTTDRITAPKKL
jgi:hypothetical protein